MFKLNNIWIKILLCIFSFASSYVMADDQHKLPETEEYLKFNSKNNILTDYQKEALNYLLEPESSSWTIEKSDIDNDTKMQIISLQVNSLEWPKKDISITSNHSQWQHRVTIYIPQKANKNTALFYVSNGILYPTEQHPDGGVQIDFKKIATETNSIVIEAKDIPNQFLAFTEKHADKISQTDGKREDELFMYTWFKYLADPQAHAYMPLHIVLAKSVMRIMTACQDFLQVKNNIEINNFVLSGASKRGWASWLTAAFDSRVVAIIPIVCDFLNLNKLIPLLLEPHNNNYVVAGMAHVFKDYLQTKNLQRLFNLVDPIGYNDFLSMPKYLISSAGDRFVPPETNQIFLDTLTNKNLRILPNKGHGLDYNNQEMLTSAIEAFYGRFLLGKTLPEVTSSLENNTIKIQSSIAPKKAMLYNLSSDTRNFIIEYNKDAYKIDTSVLKICENETSFVFPVAAKSDKWQFNIIELYYDNYPFDDFIVTTPAFISDKIEQ